MFENGSIRSGTGQFSLTSIRCHTRTSTYKLYVLLILTNILLSFINPQKKNI